MKVVLDASMALAWLFERESASETELAEEALSLLLDTEAVVPPLWHSEVCNALLVGERRAVVTQVQTNDFLNRLSRLPITTDNTHPAQSREAVIVLAREYSLSAYDAAYLELALRRDAPLASFDRKLLSSTRNAGGKILSA